MKQNKNLLISFSNGVQCQGIMNLDFAITHVSKLFPDENTTVLIMEIGEDNIYFPLYERTNGEWIDKAQL